MSALIRSPGAIAFAAVTLTFIAISAFGISGKYDFPLAWIFLGLAAVWALAEFLLPDSALRGWTPVCVTLAAFLTTYWCIPPNCGVPKYDLSQELTRPTPLDPNRLYLSVYSATEIT